MALESSRSALVLIEFQNEFTSEGGKLYESVKECIELKDENDLNMLERSTKLLNKARELGLKIVHVPISFENDYHELKDGNFGILAGIKENKFFESGTWGSEIYEPMAPAKGEIVIRGKKGLCAFNTTNLDFILKQNGIDTLILAGFLTNCCVDSTMRAAYELGYNVLTVADCTATNNLEAQIATVQHTFPLFSIPISHDNLLKNINDFISTKTESVEEQAV